MDRIRIAVVEDEKMYLEDRCENLEEIKEDCCIDVVFAVQSATEFFEQYNKCPDNVDLLVLDIELPGSYSGLDIAFKVKKPVLFVSGNNTRYLSRIEDLTGIVKVVRHLSKPVSDMCFKDTIRDICEDIRMRQAMAQKITFTIKGQKEQILASEIVFLESLSDGTNNKKIYFISHKPLPLNDFSFKRIEDWCLRTVTIVQVQKGCYVNKSRIEKVGNGKIQVMYQNDNGNSDKKIIEVSPNYMKNIH